jgi:hypothetical protein
MIVYRIQHIESGLGPFWHMPQNNEVRHYLFSQEGPAKIPTPHQDMANLYGSKFLLGGDVFCGFTSHQQLRHAFNRRVRKVLKKYGFRIFKLDVEVIAVGEYQCVFRRSNPCIEEIKNDGVV